MEALKMRNWGSCVSSRSVMLVIGFVAVAVSWSIWQMRVTQQALERAVAAERAAVRAEADAAAARDQVHGKPQALRDEAVARAARRNPKDGERVRQLYQELDALMQIQDGIEGDLHRLKSRMTKPATPAKDGAPLAKDGAP